MVGMPTTAAHKAGGKNETFKPSPSMKTSQKIMTRAIVDPRHVDAGLRLVGETSSGWGSFRNPSTITADPIRAKSVNTSIGMYPGPI